MNARVIPVFKPVCGNDNNPERTSITHYEVVYDA